MCYTTTMMSEECNNPRQRRYRTLLIGCVLIWELLIWAFSAQYDVESLKSSGGLTTLVARLLFDAPTEAQTLIARYCVRKAAHMTEYAMLGMLLLSAFRAGRTQPRALAGTFACVLLTAAVDELHQSMVPGRSCMLSDVAIDCAGAVLGCLLLYALVLPDRPGRISGRSALRR